MKRRGFIAVIAAAVVCPASAWRDGEFPIALAKGGTEMGRGQILGCWGIRCFGTAIEDGKEYERWNITHIPTGRQVPSIGGSRERARRVTERIVAAGDFSSFNGAENHPLVPRLRSLVLELIEECY